MYEKIQVEEQASFTLCGQDGYVLGVHDLLLVSLQLLYTVQTFLQIHCWQMRPNGVQYIRIEK
jgi:hypothetical protein